ncbi:MAG: malate synthase A, partial [Armatimonadetes bacterium]|nr:malate synthase A [Armatimonadota bacterium]
MEKTATLTELPGVSVTRPVSARGAEILSAEAMRFVADLARRFETTRHERLQARIERQRRIDAGERLVFLS